jgi:RimJ/RimL family protein N-acetyltransferase
VIAAPGRTLALPEGVACLEDSVTAAAARGRGIAPAAWTLIGDELQQAGFKTLVTKIETENQASRRAVEKVGYRLVAVMDHERTGPRRRTTVRPVGDGIGEMLAARLTNPPPG